MSPFLAPEDLTLRSLNKKPPEFRIADVHYYNSLKGKFSMLDKSIGVKLRAFQMWFEQYENNLKKIKEKLNPKPKRRRNNVVYQDSRISKDSAPASWATPKADAPHSGKSN